jgi:hypothetical protein
MSNTYFSHNTLEKWSVDRVEEYLTKKGITNIKGVSGDELSKMTLKKMRHIFGNHTGSNIYLIVHERLEKECLSRSKEILSKSKEKNQTLRYILDNNNYIVKNAIKSPELELQNNSIQMSRLALDSVDRCKQINKTDIHKIYNKYTILSFIDKYPPILWQNEHLHYFINFLGCDDKLINDLDVDDFIFMNPQDINKIFLNKGQFIYDALRSRFINPNIRKLQKKKEAC